MSRTPAIAMISSGFATVGGVCSVLRTIHDSELRTRWNIKFISSYRPGDVTAIFRAFLSGLCRYIWLRISSRVTVTHIHSAARGSFWRKSVFLWLAKATGSRTVFHIHDGAFLDFYFKECGTYRRRYVLKTLEACDFVVALTSGWGEKFAGLSPRIRLTVIPNPVAAPLAAKPTETGAARDCILFLGKIHHKKGVFDLLRASADILRADCALRLVCAGDGDIESLRREAEALRISSHLETPGWVDDTTKQALFARTRVFVLPSYYEGLPMSVLEAMACGVPIVATRIGGIPEAITDGAEGLLVSPGDEKSLRDAISRLLDDGLLAASMARAAQCRAHREFSVDAAVSSLDKLYRSLGASPSDPSASAAAPRTGSAGSWLHVSERRR